MKKTLFGMGLALTFCMSAPVPASATASDIDGFCQSDQNVSVSCMFLAGHQTLSQLNDPGLWAEGAVELSNAYAAVGHKAEAISLLDAAMLRQEDNVDVTAKLTFQIAAAKAYKIAGVKAASAEISRDALSLALTLENSAKKWDLVGKLASTLAVAGSPDKAQETVDAMPQETEAEAAYKARSYREIAAALAEVGQFDEARRILDKMTMGLPYYRSTARTDIAWVMAKIGPQQSDTIERLLGEAADLARTFENGYFIGGALREVGEVYALMGNRNEALVYFQEAIAAAQTAPSTQEKARAVSRVATGLSDHRFFDEAKEALGVSLQLASTMDPSRIRDWSYYEIVGSLGFSGDFERAETFLVPLPDSPFGSATSLKSVTKRDVAWGMARNGQIQQAFDFSKTINMPRERLQAIARILRVLADPDMVALPRYL